MSLPNLSTINTGFFEVGAYKVNVRRIKDGIDELDDFSKMIKERADLEAKYAKSLQVWHDKWSGHVGLRLPSGTIKDSLSHLLIEADHLSKLHNGLKERFNDEIITTVGNFKKNNHHPRTFVGSSKETHEISEAFEKAQKSWKKLADKVESAKKAFHQASRLEKSAAVNLTNARSDSSVSADALEKLSDRLEKCKEESRRTRDVYAAQVAESEKYRPVYIDNMTFVFDKCQQMELKRMKFFKEMIEGAQNVLRDLVVASKLRNLHEDLDRRLKAISEEDFEADLKNWSSVHGPDAPCTWPVFEEFLPGMRNISTYKNARNNDATSYSSAGATDDSGIVLVKHVTTTNEVPPISAPQSHLASATTTLSRPISAAYSTSLHRSPSSSSQQDSNFGTTASKKTASSSGSSEAPPTASKPVTRVIGPSSPFVDPFPMRTPQRAEDGPRANQGPAGDAGRTVIEVAGNYAIPPETPTKPLPQPQPQSKMSSRQSDDSGSYVDDVKTSVDSNDNEVADIGQMRGPAKALYDYEPIESDEIALRRGEVLEVLSGPDSLGWCMGRKDHETGLFPASYVAPL